MRRNECLTAVLRALDAAGVEPIIWHGGKHIRVAWHNPHGKQRSVTVPFSASDWRAVRNARADVRRLLRQDSDQQNELEQP